MSPGDLEYERTELELAETELDIATCELRGATARLELAEKDHARAIRRLDRAKAALEAGNEG